MYSIGHNGTRSCSSGFQSQMTNSMRHTTFNVQDKRADLQYARLPWAPHWARSKEAIDHDMGLDECIQPLSGVSLDETIDVVGWPIANVDNVKIQLAFSNNCSKELALSLTMRVFTMRLQVRISGSFRPACLSSYTILVSCPRSSTCHTPPHIPSSISPHLSMQPDTARLPRSPDFICSFTDINSGMRTRKLMDVESEVSIWEA